MFTRGDPTVLGDLRVAGVPWVAELPEGDAISDRRSRSEVDLKQIWQIWENWKLPSGQLYRYMGYPQGFSHNMPHWACGGTECTLSPLCAIATMGPIQQALGHSPHPYATLSCQHIVAVIEPQACHLSQTRAQPAHLRRVGREGGNVLTKLSHACNHFPTLLEIQYLTQIWPHLNSLFTIIQIKSFSYFYIPRLSCDLLTKGCIFSHKVSRWVICLALWRVQIWASWVDGKSSKIGFIVSWH